MTTYKTFPTLLISDNVLFDSTTLGSIIWQQHDRIFLDMAEELGLLDRATMNDPEPQLLLDWRAEMKENLRSLRDNYGIHSDPTIDENMLRDMYLFLWKRSEKDPETQAAWDDWQKRKERLNKKEQAAYDKAQSRGGYFDDTHYSNQQIELHDELEEWITDAKSKGKNYWTGFGWRVLGAVDYKPGAKEFLDILLASRRDYNELMITIFSKNSFAPENYFKALQASFSFHTAFNHGAINPGRLVADCHGPYGQAMSQEDDLFVMAGEAFDSKKAGWKDWRKATRGDPRRRTDRRIKEAARDIRTSWREIDANPGWTEAEPGHAKEMRAQKREVKKNRYIIKIGIMFLQNLKREREAFVGLRDITVICEDADLCQRFAEQPLKEGDKLMVIHCVPGGDRGALPTETVTDLAAMPALLGIKVKPKDLRATIARNHQLAGIADFDYP